MSTLRSCNDCGAEVGSNHVHGCDVERCALCGHQCIGACECVYELNGIDVASMAEDHPQLYEGGATDEMYAVYDAAVDAAGGPLPWEGVYPGTKECIEFGWHSKWTDAGWQKAKAGDEGAGPNLNRLCAEAKWSKGKRRWVLP